MGYLVDVESYLLHDKCTEGCDDSQKVDLRRHSPKQLSVFHGCNQRLCKLSTYFCMFTMHVDNCQSLGSQASHT